MTFHFFENLPNKAKMEEYLKYALRIIWYTKYRQVMTDPVLQQTALQFHQNYLTRLIQSIWLIKLSPEISHRLAIYTL